MTEKEMAQEYEKNAEYIEIDDYGHKVYGSQDIEQAFLAGLKAGRPKWHKPSEKLPEECSLVLAFEFEDSEPTLFEFVTSNTWEWMPRRIACLHNDQIKCWCEIPKFKE